MRFMFTKLTGSPALVIRRLPKSLILMRAVSLVYDFAGARGERSVQYGTNALRTAKNAARPLAAAS